MNRRQMSRAELSEQGKKERRQREVLGNKQEQSVFHAGMIVKVNQNITYVYDALTIPLIF